MHLLNYQLCFAKGGTFSENVRQTLVQLIPTEHQVVTLNFFCSFSLEEVQEMLDRIRREVVEVLGYLPLINIVAQQPSNGIDLALEAGVLTDDAAKAEVNYFNTPYGKYLVLENDSFRAMIVEGIFCEDFSLSIGQQSEIVFAHLEEIFYLANFSVSDIVRQWNYIGHITDIENERQNYQEFNNARARFYAKTKWENGYPAATGISMEVRAVSVSLIALQVKGDERIVAVDNSLQIAAHRYSQKVLVASETKETPKFERAKLIVGDKSSVCYVSGTAAILGENSIDNGLASVQTRETIALIRHLISSENIQNERVEMIPPLELVHLRIYVKNVKDSVVIQEVVEQELPGVAALYLNAGVCREELLVEIEGVAISTHLS